MPELLRESLRRLREYRGLTRGQLSRATVRLGYAGVPESTLEAYEKRSGQVPKADVLRSIAEVLGVDPSYFYEWPLAAAKAGIEIPGELPEDIAEEAARLREEMHRADDEGAGQSARRGRAT